MKHPKQNKRAPQTYPSALAVPSYHRILVKHGLIEKTLSIPDAYEVFLKVGADPEVQKLRRKVERGNKMKHVIVGLYLNPPENAVVLCVDEKSGIQPMLPLELGYVEGVTHDYRRHGTTTLFAALDTANGKVLTKCRPHHRHQEYLSVLREELVTKIDHYVRNSNRSAQPFVWTATADSIFAKVERLCERIYGTAH
jgi:hypothetical protein